MMYFARRAVCCFLLMGKAPSTVPVPEACSVPVICIGNQQLYHHVMAGIDSSSVHMFVLTC